MFGGVSFGLNSIDMVAINSSPVVIVSYRVPHSTVYSSFVDTWWKLEGVCLSLDTVTMMTACLELITWILMIMLCLLSWFLFGNYWIVIVLFNFWPESCNAGLKLSRITKKNLLYHFTTYTILLFTLYWSISDINR